jgi:6-phosphofructokinase 1
MLTPQDLVVPTLGPCRIPTPLDFDSPSHPNATHFLTDQQRVRYQIRQQTGQPPVEHDLTFEEAGPRDSIFFDPARTTAAIVTCGGLSPGLNNVIRSAFYELTKNYRVPNFFGIRNGYLGLNSTSGLVPIKLSADFVESIDKLGGTAIGTSRGAQSPAVMADFLAANQIDILLCVGGDGTQRGAHELHQELQRRGRTISVVGIPKTIDNDVPFVGLSFGYATALEKAAEVIRGAHVEARNAVNGIGLVKLMGRHAGSIAAGASLVSQEVDFTLVPEIPFPLNGENGFLAALTRRMQSRGHAVVVVAEGAGQHLFDQGNQQCDASGNPKPQDIAALLQARIQAHFSDCSIPISLKYLDPSYFIRSVPANSFDRVLCNHLARHAVHAAMAGKTGIMIGHQHDCYVHVPLPTVIRDCKTMDVTGDLWRAVLESTGQPRW